MTPAIKFATSALKTNASDFKWFDLTEFVSTTFEEVKEITKRPSHLRPYLDITGANFPLPFERIAVVDRFEPVDDMKRMFNKRGIVDLKEEGVIPTGLDHAIAINTFVRQQDSIVYSSHQFDITKPPCNMVFKDSMWNGKTVLNSKFYAQHFYAQHKTEMTERDMKDAVWFESLRFAYYTIRILELLYGSGEIKLYTPKASPTTLRQLAKGKPRAYNWSTVEIKPYRREPAPSQGGTHASPTPHERRGHVRRLKSGKVVTVRSSLVNKHKIPQQGITYHDYKGVTA
jgi:hypothetical protein